MFRSRWILAALLAALVIGAIYVSSNPEMAQRYSASVRDAQISTGSKDLVMGGILFAILAYLAWFFMVRKG